MNPGASARRGMKIFYVYYALLYMINACSAVFSIYFQSIGFSVAQIGQILAVGSAVSLLAQPIWGKAGDRAKSKIRVVQLLALLLVLVVAAMPFSGSYGYVLLVFTLFFFLVIPLIPMTDALTIEYMDRTGGHYSVVRACGPLGFGLISLTLGPLLNGRPTYVFYLLVAILALVALLGFKVPSLPHTPLPEGALPKRAPMRDLFKDKGLLLLLGFLVLMQISHNFYAAFEAVFCSDISGGDNNLIGYSMALCSVSEVIFLLFADKLWRAIGTRKLLLISSAFMMLRYFGLALVAQPAMLLVMDMTHAFCFAATTFALARYIARSVVPELQISGQMLVWVLAQSFAKIVSTLFGGMLVDAMGGIQPVFWIAGGLVAAAAAAFILLSKKVRDPEQEWLALHI
mgnify:CR=1 FL=1|jgi:PPP family 3-phenylpropionic acid transporter